MKRMRLFLAASLVFLMSCGGGFFMVEKDTKPEIKADPDKAVLVIYRGTSFGFAVEIDDFVDNKFIGQTKGKCFFITKIDPGTHYIVAASENNACAKINFEAGKVYYLLQGIYPGVMFARTGFSGSDPASFEKDLPDMTFYAYEPTDEPPTMEEDDYKQTIADFEKELTEDPERHKDVINIKGY